MRRAAVTCSLGGPAQSDRRLVRGLWNGKPRSPHPQTHHETQRVAITQSRNGIARERCGLACSFGPLGTAPLGPSRSGLHGPPDPRQRRPHSALRERKAVGSQDFPACLQPTSGPGGAEHRILGKSEDSNQVSGSLQLIIKDIPTEFQRCALTQWSLLRIPGSGDPLSDLASAQPGTKKRLSFLSGADCAHLACIDMCNLAPFPHKRSFRNHFCLLAPILRARFDRDKSNCLRPGICQV